MDFRRCITAILLSGFALLTSAAEQHTNFRIGSGAFIADMQNAPEWMPDGSQTGVTLFAEFPQSNHAASRLVLYRINSDDVSMQGGETQLMWGWGLAEPGLRLYTGPAWHYDKLQVQRGNHDRTRVFNGWGWQLGVGFQYQAITLDIAGTFRDADDYNTENSYAGNRKGDVWTQSLLLSYRF